MKNTNRFGFLLALIVTLLLVSCEKRPSNQTALDEQAQTERNQADLNKVQPAPKISYSLERENLINRFKLMNERDLMFYMYLFIEGVAEPIGYYQVNKVSSVNSQLTNTNQIVDYYRNGVHVSEHVLPSPAEDGSYGTNGDAIFGFTPENIYIESNMKYVVSNVPLKFRNAVQRLAVIDNEEARAMIEKSRKVLSK